MVLGGIVLVVSLGSKSCSQCVEKTKLIILSSNRRDFSYEARQAVEDIRETESSTTGEEDNHNVTNPEHRLTLYSAISLFRKHIREPPSDVIEMLQVWHALDRADNTGHRLIAMESLHHTELRRFAEILVEFGSTSLKEPTPSVIQTANVLDAILKEIHRRTPKNPPRSDKYLHWHLKILRREYLSVAEALSRENYHAIRKHPKLIQTMSRLFTSVHYNSGLAQAVDILLVFPDLLFTHLKAENRFAGLVDVESKRVRDLVFGAFSSVTDPLGWITTAAKSEEAQIFAMRIFFWIYKKRGDTDQSWHLFECLQARHIIIPFEIQVDLLKLFAKERAFQCAEGIKTSLQTHFKELVTEPDKRVESELYGSLYLASIQGDFQKAQDDYNIIVSRGFVVPGARRLLMHAYAVGDKPERAEELFSELFRPGASAQPTLRDYREVIYAHVRAKNLTAVNHWLEKMMDANIPPNLSIYNNILAAFAQNNDIEASISIMSKMYENNIQPDKFSFTTVMSIYAAKKDPFGAEKLYQRALKEGIEPDEVMTLALMNAHIDAGSWQGAIRVFDYLNTGKRIHKSRYLGQLYNLLLKAYVLIGAPFNVVLKIFRRFEKLNLIPTLRTYTLLIQSACDSKRMDIARDLFLELDTLPTYGRLKSHIDAYLMTVLIAGFLRAGDMKRARLVYEDMLSRDLRPKATTFSIIVRSFADRRTAESLRTAEEFIHSLLDMDETHKTWLNTLRGGPNKALEALFAPLMTIYGYELDIAGVQRLHEYMISAGGDPTVTSLTILMDAYRRTGNLKAVEEVWLDVVTVARRFTQKDLLDRLPVFKRHSPDDEEVSLGSTSEIPSYQTNTLCMPLSVYIEALSFAGKHIEIAKVWKQVRDWGFAFDAHNWNHLAIALVKAGEVERGFEIVERVLIPHHKKEAADIVRDRKKNPSSPFFFVKASVSKNTAAVDGNKAVQETTTDFPPASSADAKHLEEEEEEKEEARQQPVGSHLESRRIESIAISTRQQRKFMLTDSDVDSPDMDPAQPLHELQQMSAHYQGWRTHTRTLKTLQFALHTLGSGQPVRATKESGSLLSSADEVDDSAETRIREKMEDDWSDVSHQDAERMVAAEILDSIMVRYPKSLVLVERYIRRQELRQYRADLSIA
ncbi:hypothetical protein Clacol_001448 [Clathrus columnatus]|uniref:Pentatricopeptide repeat-containing protein n=1 Tax=Clathrus columnatus TaxID=1419009 RepID=A0AAV5A192_9AGAM|nr:hypothetical protein Clacol_001448 [Clathrus columnatus]